MFKHWFVVSNRASTDMCKPKLQTVTHCSEMYKKSVKWNAINEWNEFQNDKKVNLDYKLYDFDIKI